VVYQGQGLSQGAQSLFDLPRFPICLSQQRKIRRPRYLGPCGSPGCQPLSHLCDAFLSLPLFGKCPAPEERCLREQELKAVFASEPHFRLGTLVGGLHFSAELMRPDGVSQGIRQDMGV
jgi:hypothetical protein